MPISDETINESADQAERDATESSEPKFNDLTASRQRTVMQSFMMYNIGAFGAYSASQTTDRFPYGGFQKVLKLSGPPAGIINKLTMVSGSTEFIEMKPHEISNFVPKIRIFKVLYNEDGSLDKEIEFKFPTRLDKSPGDEFRPTPLLPVNILDQTTNSGVGIKSFDYEFIGSNPATVRSDVKAKMVLFFQNFSELLRVRYAEDGTSYAYIDLFDRARKMKDGDDNDGVEAPEATSRIDAEKLGLDAELLAGCNTDQLVEKRSSYDPTEFEIRAVVGWADMSPGGSSITNDTLKEVGKNANYSFTLTLVDHDFDFEDDGTFTLTLDYRARLAGILSDGKADVLNLENITEGELPTYYGSNWDFLPEYVQAKLSDFYDGTFSASPKDTIRALEYYIDVARACCDTEGEQEIKDALSAYKDTIRTYKHLQAAYWLNNNRRLFSLEVPAETINAFAQKRQDAKYTITPDLLNKGTVDLSEIESVSKKVMVEGIRGEPVNKWKDSIDADIDIADAGTVKISYFYIGDLIEWGAQSAINSITQSDDKVVWDTSISEKIKVLLGSLNIENPIPGQDNIRMSIADIPVSMETFKAFWFNKVIKPRRDNYPLIHFIRDVVKMAAQDALNSPWLNKDEDRRQRVILRTAAISLPTVNEEDPLVEWMRTHFIDGRPYSDFSTVDMEAVTEKDPLTFRKSDVDVNNLFNYFVVYLENGSLSYLSKSAVDSNEFGVVGRKAYDKILGIHHFGFGENRGILKTAKFSKTNAPYLREARYESHRGYSPFDQLSAVYEVEVTTFGAPFYYPGQYLWIEPRGLNYNSDPDYRLGSPDNGYNEDGQGGSFAFIMGLGGYHIITKVSGYLEDGKYETKIHCRYDNSGADRGERKGYGTQDDESSKCGDETRPKGFFGGLF